MWCLCAYVYQTVLFISPYTLLIDFCAIYFLLVQTDCTEGAEVTETVRPWARTQIFCFACQEKHNRGVRRHTPHTLLFTLLQRIFQKYFSQKLKSQCIEKLLKDILHKNLKSFSQKITKIIFFFKIFLFFFWYLNTAFELEVCQLWGRQCRATNTHYCTHTLAGALWWCTGLRRMWPLYVELI